MRSPRAAAALLACGALAGPTLLAPPSARARDEASPPTITRTVTDLASALDAATVTELDRLIVDHHAATGVQLAVLVVPTTGELPLEDYALAAAEEWAGGAAGSDLGALLVIATRDRRMRLEVGYGLEGELPDGRVRRLLDDARPAFAAGRPGEGALRVVRSVIDRTNHLDEGSGERPEPPLGTRLPWSYLAVFAAGLALGWLGGRGEGCSSIVLLAARFAVGPAVVAWTFRAGDGLALAYAVVLVVASVVPPALRLLARGRESLAGAAAAGLIGAPVIVLGFAPLEPQPGLRGEDVLLLLLFHLLAGMAAIVALPVLRHAPWLLPRLLWFFGGFAGGRTYGSGGRVRLPTRLPGPRRLPGSGGRFGGGGASSSW